MAFLQDIHVYVEKKKRDKEYDEIHKSSRSPFQGRDYLHTFLMAMIIGKNRNARAPLEGSRHDLFQTSALNDEDEWLIKSVAIATKENLDILLDEKEILKIAEEYANAGVLLLHDLIFGGAPGDSLKKLEAGARDIYLLLNPDVE